jgi:molybdopterin synthase catalytic subunit
MLNKMERKPKNIFVQGPITSAFIGEAIQKHSTQHNIGAHSLFLGQVRADDMTDGTVQAITYSAYEPMAIQKSFEIREEIFLKYDLTCMHIYHSLGNVNAGEICLFVFTSSKHRHSAIQACEEIVEKIKKELPIWGLEKINGDTSIWKQNI